MNYQTKDVNFYTADPYTNHSRIIRQYVRINGFDNSIVTNYRIIHLYHGQSNKLIRAVTNADKTYISWIMDTYVPQTYLSRTEFFFFISSFFTSDPCAEVAGTDHLVATWFPRTTDKSQPIPWIRVNDVVDR